MFGIESIHRPYRNLSNVGSHKKCTTEVPYVRHVIALSLLVKSFIESDDGLIQSETCSQASRKTTYCALTDDLSFSCIERIIIIHEDILNCDFQPYRDFVRCH
jgi:hypothetical protein